MISGKWQQTPSRQNCVQAERAATWRWPADRDDARALVTAHRLPKEGRVVCIRRRVAGPMPPDAGDRAEFYAPKMSELRLVIGDPEVEVGLAWHEKDVRLYCSER